MASDPLIMPDEDIAVARPALAEGDRKQDSTPIAQETAPMPADALAVPLSLFRIGRILDSSYDPQEREEAVRQLLARLWKRFPIWERYRASCAMTTRVFLPYGMHLLEWNSFPGKFLRALRANGFEAWHATHQERRDKVVRTLRPMLGDWLQQQRGNKAPSMDIGADLCEAIGRLGIYEAEHELLDVVEAFRNFNNQARMAALMALATLPPDRLEALWANLKKGSFDTRRLSAATFAYIGNPAFVPFLLEVFACQTLDADLENVGQPLLLRLGYLGDVRALPLLTEIARRDNHPLQHIARTAILRLTKQAQGMEEVTLVRASSASTLHQDVLLRPVQDAPAYPSELLRPSGASEQAPSQPSGEHPPAFGFDLSASPSETPPAAHPVREEL